MGVKIGLTALLMAFAMKLVSCDGISSLKYKGEHPALNLDDVTVSKGSFWENFQSYQSLDDFDKKWISSSREIKDRHTGDIVQQYPLGWGIEESYLVPGFSGDKGMVIYHESGFAMIGHAMENPITFEDDDDLVVQYEVKMQTKLECGGAFLKLLPPSDADTLKNYGSEDSPLLELLFGPDNCLPYTDEIHFGIRKQNPVSKKDELKFLDKAPVSQLGSDLKSHLYTLIVKGKTQDFEIRFDGEVVLAANLLDKGLFTPEFGAPKTIPDPNAVKPADWDERETIADEDQKKPADWDDRQTIADPEDKKPETWDELIPELISDASRKQPTWWNEEEDGKWIAPKIVNPACESESGCGKWKPKQIKNPDYKGPWTQPTKPNPAYQGTWEAPEIENPDYYEDAKPSKLQNAVGTILFEFWGGSIDLVFDNIYIGKSIEEAELLGNKTFVTKRELEDKEIELGGGQDIAMENPSNLLETIKEYVLSLPPMVQGLAIGSVLVGVILLSVAFIMKGYMMLVARDEAKEAKKKETKSKSKSKKSDKTTAKTTGTETADGDNSKVSSRSNKK